MKNDTHQFGMLCNFAFLQFQKQFDCPSKTQQKIKKRKRKTIKAEIPKHERSFFSILQSYFLFCFMPKSLDHWNSLLRCIKQFFFCFGHNSIEILHLKKDKGYNLRNKFQ